MTEPGIGRVTFMRIRKRMDPFALIHPGFLSLGSTEVIIILVVAVLLFGGRLPKIARDFGKVFFEFRKNIRDLQSEFYRQDYPPPAGSIPDPYDRAPYTEPAPVEAEISSGDEETPPGGNREEGIEAAGGSEPGPATGEGKPRKDTPGGKEPEEGSPPSPASNDA